MLCTIAFVATGGCGNDIGTPNTYDVDAGTSTGLPCDVQQVLADHCESCHGTPLAGGAPLRIASYGDLVRVKDGRTIAELSLARMTSTTAPMPPAPAARLAGDAIAVFQGWIDAGMPVGDCAGGTGPFDTPPICTSNSYWTGGDAESEVMKPGAACGSCHGAGGELPFAIAGTVYPTAHEPTDCNGATGATIQITDATGATFALPVNAAGNFYREAAVVFPIRAKVIAGGSERVMVGAVDSGDCNSCHTQTGANLAPGRIVMP